jgi:hypothetical protein
MSEDEDHTLDLIRRDLKLMKRMCERYEGRVLKSTGDGLLMYFISGVKAVECAVQIQQTIAENALSLSARDALVHRIGIHLADMFISETDVMGNGVNIAARLQAEAEPGGICFSQTVYDVVKSGLQVATKYVGLRELKNIREVVPVYKVLLHPELPEHDRQAETIRNLERHKNHLRIKKLLHYICKNIWETDQSSLIALKMPDLLQDLAQVAPTLKRLEQVLEAAVRTLNKPAEYSVIASAILQEARQLYEDQSDPLGAAQADAQATIAFNTAVSGVQTQQPLYEQLAQALEQATNPARLKKLLFYVCHNRWENDPTRLQNLPLAQLVEELHRLASTVEQLRSTLDGFVQTLSKQAEYRLVADAIVTLLEPHLAAATPALATTTTQSSAIPTETYLQVANQLEQEQNWLRIKKLLLYLCRKQWESNTALLNSIETEALVRELHQLSPTITELAATIDPIVNSLNKAAEYQPVARAIIRHMSQLYPGSSHGDLPTALELSLPTTSGDRETFLPEAALTDPPEPDRRSSPPRSVFSLLDARLGIMKYTNPLRAKIVLFSALHEPFDFAPQDWLNLKMHDLDGLLQHILSICKTYTDLEAKLYAAARGLQSSEEHVQTASTVIKSLRPFYVFGGTLPPVIDSEMTRLNLDDFEMATQEFTRLNEHENLSEAAIAASEPTGLRQPNQPETATPIVPTAIEVRSTTDATQLEPPASREPVEYASE